MEQISHYLKDYRTTGSDHTAAPAPLKLAGHCSPDCPVCGGLGWIRYDVPVTDPRFGKMQLCPELEPHVLATESGLSEKELSATWGQISRMNNAWEGVKAVQAAIERGAGWVMLWGPPGLAKTLIMQIAVAESIRARKAAVYVRMVEIIDNLRAAFDAPDSSSEEERRLERWSAAPLLAIDEFDRVRDSAYSGERRFLLMDRRYQDAVRGNTITLMSSNADPRKFDDYLASRILDGRFAVVHLTGDDVRPMMEW